MSLTEKNELELLKNSSMQSFDALYFRYSAKLYNFVLKISKGNSYMAEELVQRTFIKVWENRDQINPDKTFISYLCTIAKNMLVNEYEHQTIQFIYNEYVRIQVTDIENITELDVDKMLLDEYIEKLTEKLPPKRREIFILSRRKGLSNKQISELLHISESTIETQLSKALAFMKNELNMYYEYVFVIVFYLFVK
jgi:RNA polymerase sigma-70 factor (ECF subfamily)